MKKKKPNRTHDIVRAAMKAVAKDVRAPKVVRDGIVSPMSTSCHAIPYIPKNIFVKRMILDEIKFGRRQVLNVPAFSTRRNINKWWNEFDGPDAYLEYQSQLIIEDVEIDLGIPIAKFTKLMNKFKKLHGNNERNDGGPLYTAPTINKLTLIIGSSDSKSVQTIHSDGYLTGIEYHEDGSIRIIFRPNYFSID